MRDSQISKEAACGVQCLCIGGVQGNSTVIAIFTSREFAKLGIPFTVKKTSQPECFLTRGRWFKAKEIGIFPGFVACSYYLYLCTFLNFSLGKW